MNKRIRELALESGLLNYVDNETPRRYFVHADIEMEDIEKFAALVAAEVDKNWVQGKAKINVPTATMEQEFNNYHRLGYKAGAAAEREACARVCEEFEMAGHALWDRTADPDAQGRATAAADCAAAIRARGEK